jgi:hypothetical protein
MMLAGCAGIPAQDLGANLTGESRMSDPSRAQVPARPSRVFTAEAPARLMVIGDSLAQGFAMGLEERVKQRGLLITVESRGRVSTGLSRTDFHDWPTDFAELAAAEHPDIVVAHFGANDMQGVTREGNRASYGSDGWETAYRGEIRRILDVAAANKAVLMWLGPGPDGHSALDEHLRRLNPIFEEEALASGALFLSIPAFAAGPKGEFVKSISLNGQDTTIRTGDGSHFNMTGYALVADRVLDDLVRRFPDLSPAPIGPVALQ